MIRPAQAGDLDALISLWLTTTIEAHPFISEAYWRESEPLVRSDYLPKATIWLAEHSGELLGFLSVMEHYFIGALFVARPAQGSGIGRALMEHAKSVYPELLLEVYKENVDAIGFYIKQGFTVISEQPHPGTGHVTYVMRWRR